MRLWRRLRQPGILSVVAGLAVALVLGTPAGAANITAVQIFFEFNSTDNDLGVQVFLDASAWQSLTITDPDGNTTLQIEAQGSLRTLGLTELFFESDEPSPEEVLALFKPGKYVFEGTGVDGQSLTGMATLSHDLPEPVVVIFPQDGGSVDPDDAAISWTHPNPSALAGVQVIVENVTTGVQVAAFSLPASATTVQVAPQVFAGPGKKYKVEVLALSKNGNKTIVEVPFTAR